MRHSTHTKLPPDRLRRHNKRAPGPPHQQPRWALRIVSARHTFIGTIDARAQVGIAYRGGGNKSGLNRLVDEKIVQCREFSHSALIQGTVAGHRVGELKVCDRTQRNTPQTGT